MYVSGAEVPPASVTVTFTGPTAPGGVRPVSESSLLATTTFVAGPSAPKVTTESGPRLDPLIVKACPPVVGPVLGTMFEAIGVTSYKKPLAMEAVVVLVPKVFDTLTATSELLAWFVAGGLTAVISVELTTLTFVALLAPNFTVEVGTKPVPLMSTAVPPGQDRGRA